MCGARVGTSASWLSDADASLRLHGMMRDKAHRPESPETPIHDSSITALVEI